MGLGCAEGYTHDYLRHGTTTLFADLDVATGKVMRAAASGTAASCGWPPCA